MPPTPADKLKVLNDIDTLTTTDSDADRLATLNFLQLTVKNDIIALGVPVIPADIAKLDVTKTTDEAMNEVKNDLTPKPFIPAEINDVTDEMKKKMTSPDDATKVEKEKVLLDMEKEVIEARKLSANYDEKIKLGRKIQVIREVKRTLPEDDAAIEAACAGKSPDERANYLQDKMDKVEHDLESYMSGGMDVTKLNEKKNILQRVMTKHGVTARPRPTPPTKAPETNMDMTKTGLTWAAAGTAASYVALSAPVVIEAAVEQGFLSALGTATLLMPATALGAFLGTMIARKNGGSKLKGAAVGGAIGAAVDIGIHTITAGAIPAATATLMGIGAAAVGTVYAGGRFIGWLFKKNTPTA